MATTTIRIDTDTHVRLLELSRAAGTSLIDTARDAADALARQRFGHRVAAEVAELQQDPEAWAAYLVEAEATSVRDGVG